MCVEHGDFGGASVVVHKDSGDSDPLVALHGADFAFSIGDELFGDIFPAPGLDVELVLEDERGAERTHARLVLVHGGEVVVSCVLEELVGLLHGHGGFLRVENGLSGGDGAASAQEGGNANYEQCCGKTFHNS